MLRVSRPTLIVNRDIADPKLFISVFKLLLYVISLFLQFNHQIYLFNNYALCEKFISTLQHAGDMGIELHKAEMSLKYGFKYVQDKSLNIDKGKKFK